MLFNVSHSNFSRFSGQDTDVDSPNLFRRTDDLALIERIEDSKLMESFWDLRQEVFLHLQVFSKISSYVCIDIIYLPILWVLQGQFLATSNGAISVARCWSLICLRFYPKVIRNLTVRLGPKLVLIYIYIFISERVIFRFLSNLRRLNKL